MTRQEFLVLQLRALDGLKRKELCYGRAADGSGRPCAIHAFNILYWRLNQDLSYMKCYAAVIEVNDLDPTESPAARFVRVRSWVAAQLGGESL